MHGTGCKILDMSSLKYMSEAAVEIEAGSSPVFGISSDSIFSNRPVKSKSGSGSSCNEKHSSINVRIYIQCRLTQKKLHELDHGWLPEINSYYQMLSITV